MKQNLPIGILLWCALVLIASFMSWAAVRGYLGNTYAGMYYTLNVNAWNGTLTLARVQIPNWLIVPAAVGVALVAVLRAFGFKQASPIIEWALSILGALYMIAFMFFIVGGGGTLGIGSILALISFIGIVVSLVLQSRSKRSPAAPLAGDTSAV